MGEKDLFVFGNKLGDGGEDNLFQLGFTCLTMLKRIKEFNNFGCFHVDATYKIVKFCFPLIVFGFTDVSRRFFPIAFMFTSHEKQTDYLHFFASLLDTYNSIGIDFKPTYMLCDATRILHLHFMRWFFYSTHCTRNMFSMRYTLPIQFNLVVLILSNIFKIANKFKVDNTRHDNKMVRQNCFILN